MPSVSSICNVATFRFPVIGSSFISGSVNIATVRTPIALMGSFVYLTARNLICNDRVWIFGHATVYIYIVLEKIHILLS